MISELRPQLVTAIPEHPETGVFYVSVEYATSLHLCACGCGHEVVLGISPTDWKVLWDGRTVSVSPSVGNWSLPCQSHYVIRRNRIEWAEHWSDEKIARGRAVNAVRKRPVRGPLASQPVCGAPAKAEPSRWRLPRLRNLRLCPMRQR